jgi:hypothetical protein
MGVKMKTKFLLFACILFVLMLFACDGTGNADNSENNAAQGVVTLSFAVESEDAVEKAISVNNPNFTDHLTYQYKAVPSFKLADGSTPVGTTGDVWTDLKEELPFSVGDWTFDVRVIQKGNNYDADNTDFIIVYNTAGPLKTSVTSASAKFVTFIVKKTIEGTGVIHINIAVTNQKAGKMVVNLYEIPSGQLVSDGKIAGKYADQEKKLYFIKDLEVASGFYRMTIVYDDGNEEYKYYPGLIEVLDKQETFVEGDIEIDVPDPEKPYEPVVAPFYSTNGKSELKGEVSLEKTIFSVKDDDLILTIKGKISAIAPEIQKIENDIAKKINLNAVKVVYDAQAKKKVDNQQLKQLEQKELKPVLLKETIVYKFIVDKKEYDAKDLKNGQYHITGLKPGKHTIGVTAQSSLDKVLYAKINPIDITVTE